MTSLRDMILEYTPSSGWERIEEVHSQCALVRQKKIATEEFGEALSGLVETGQVTESNGRIKRSELDCAELDLYDAIEAALWSPALLKPLRLNSERTVVQKTATGGTQNTGLYSRPDFTLATIRRFKYDPLQHLDLFTFEVKNLAGANLMAVHEALAHTRFGHYSYLLCPRSRLHPEQTELLQTACAEHQIGLITFDIDSIDPKVEINNFEVELEAVRRSADPYRVETYIEDRLTEDVRTRLEKLANTP